MSWYRKLGRYVIVSVMALVMLAGCAQTWSARILQFEQWPAHTDGASYALVLTEEQRNNLQYQAVEDALRAVIGGLGLVEADEQSARFLVYSSFKNPLKRRWVERYQGPMFAPFGGYWGGAYGMWGGGFYYGPDWVVVPVDVYENELSVRIIDTEQGDQEVYRATAISEDPDEDFLMQISLLAEAVFEDFPGISGQGRIIEKNLGR